MNKEELAIGNTVIIRLTKPKKRGRPSKEDKRIYGVNHTIIVPENTPKEELFIEFQKEADRLKLPVKFI